MSKRLYHGTRAGDQIADEGFQVSTSGFGGLYLRGVGLAAGFDEAASYARNARWCNEGPPEVLTVELSACRLLDMRGWVERWLDVVTWLGFDYDDDDDLDEIRRRFCADPFWPTNALIERGWDGAIIDSTTGRDDPEHCIFDTTLLRVVERVAIDRFEWEGME